MNFGKLSSIEEQDQESTGVVTAAIDANDAPSATTTTFFGGLFGPSAKQQELEKQKLEQERLIKEQLKQLGMDKELDEQKKTQDFFLKQAAEQKAKDAEKDGDDSDLSDNISAGDAGSGDDTDDELVAELKEMGLPPMLICSGTSDTRVSRMSIRRDSYLHDLMTQKKNLKQEFMEEAMDDAFAEFQKEIENGAEEKEERFVEIFESMMKVKEKERKGKKKVLDDQIFDEKWKLRNPTQT